MNSETLTHLTEWMKEQEEINHILSQRLAATERVVAFLIGHSGRIDKSALTPEEEAGLRQVMGERDEPEPSAEPVFVEIVTDENLPLLPEGRVWVKEVGDWAEVETRESSEGIADS